MTRYWASWYSGNYEDEGCTNPPFQFWNSGYRDRNNGSGRDDCTLCAMIDAEREEDIWGVVAKHFPDYEERFCEEREPDAMPGDRFPGFENRTNLSLGGKEELASSERPLHEERLDKIEKSGN